MAFPAPHERWSRTVVPTFAVGVEWKGDAVHLRVRGELDIAVGERLVERVKAVCTSSVRTVLVDLHDVTFMDSSGLRALLATQKAADPDGHVEVVVVRPSPVVRDVIGITGAEPLLRLAEDVEAVLQGRSA